MAGPQVQRRQAKQLQQKCIVAAGSVARLALFEGSLQGDNHFSRAQLRLST